MKKQRLTLALKYGCIHFAVSALIALLAAFFIFHLLYPTPFYKLLGVSEIFIILVGVDVVCGPIFTAIVSSPTKHKKEVFTDIILICLIQLSALAYGLFSVYQARPVMTVFEKDRFVLISANEVQLHELNNALPEFRTLKHWGVGIASTRTPKSGSDMLDSIESSLGGIDVSLRPSWWVNYDQDKPNIISTAKKISNLINDKPEHKNLIGKKLLELNLNPDNTLYLPFVSKKNYDWIALLDYDGNIIGHLNISGF